MVNLKMSATVYFYIRDHNERDHPRQASASVLQKHDGPIKKLINMKKQFQFLHSPARRFAGVLLAVMGAAVPVSGALAQSAIPDTIAQRALACAACHGKEGRATNEGFFPRIAGKPVGYLYNQMVNFRDGHRQYPMMTYMVDQMSDAYLKELAEYFASQHLPYPPPPAANATPAQLERGKQLVLSGDAARNVPACIACHGQKLTGVAPSIPGLLGLPRDYLNAQIGSWRNKTRRTPAPDCMAEIATRLNPEDISAVSAWLAAQAVPGDSTPARSLPVKLPMPCGSVATVNSAVK